MCLLGLQGQHFFEFVIWSSGKQWEILLVAISKCCLCRLLTAKSGSWKEYLSSQFSWVTAWWLATRVWPVHLIDELVLVFYIPPYDWANRSSVDVSSGWWPGEYSFITLGVDAILGNGCGIQGQNSVKVLQGSGMTTRYHYRNWILCICFKLPVLDALR